MRLTTETLIIFFNCGGGRESSTRILIWYVYFSVEIENPPSKSKILHPAPFMTGRGKMPATFEWYYGEGNPHFWFANFK